MKTRGRKHIPREMLKAAIAEGKRIRKYYFGNLYALTDLTTSPKDWCVLQYHRQERKGTAWFWHFAGINRRTRDLNAFCVK